ncbi:mycofactocin precursor MftA [Saccharopolyspora sp. ASAGF58]|nr:mycofactocin precursor MftA [Saccharopolyspora sp. ASAGF58]
MEQQSLGTEYEHTTGISEYDESRDVVEEMLVEEVSIDGMCGVY